MKFINLVFSIVAVSLFAPSNFAADQIYRCKQANGYVYRQIPCADHEVVADTAPKRVWKALRKLSVEGKLIIRELTAEVASIKQCEASMLAHSEKLNQIKPQVSRISIEYNELAKAYNYLQECAVCKSSAESYCRSADVSLDKVMPKLVQ